MDSRNCGILLVMSGTDVPGRPAIGRAGTWVDGKPVARPRPVKANSSFTKYIETF